MNTESQRQTRITLQEVQGIITQLQEQGFNNPSVRQIYQALGRRGSFSKIIELKKQVLANMLSPLSNTVTHNDNSVINLANVLANDLSNSVTQLNNSTSSSVIHLDNTLAHLENSLWERIQNRLDEWWSKHDPAHTELHQLNEQLAKDNQELTNQLNQLQSDYEAIQGRLQQSTLETVDSQPPAQSPSTLTQTEPLESYFQILTQLQSLSPARKYDCAMTLFEHGIGPSEASRILAVNKGSLQHYKDGKRPRPQE